MIKWCSSFWKQRKARLPDCIRILPVRRNAAIFQKERIPLHHIKPKVVLILADDMGYGANGTKLSGLVDVRTWFSQRRGQAGMALS